jgi:hypothetical protein
VADSNLGQSLIEMGWDQGSIVAATANVVFFHAEYPVTKAARLAQPQLVAEVEEARKSRKDVLPIGLAATPMKAAAPTEFLVIASQACDIAKSTDTEHSVVALRAFVTSNDRITRAGATNSSKYFLLDADRSLVADASWFALLEKPVLTAFTPAAGIPDDATKRRFAHWIARRFNRPALPDDIAAAVVAPIITNLRFMQDAGDPLISALESVREVRLLRLEGGPPFNARLLLLVGDDVDEDRRADLAAIIGRIHGWLDPKTATLAAAEVRTMFEVSVGDYIQTDQIYLDEFTYRGTTVEGLKPPPAV